MVERKTILFAEDSEFVRPLSKRIIKRYFPDYNLEVYKDGLELEERLRKGSQGLVLVITDDEMPNLNGSVVVEKYAQREEFKHIPFLIASSSLSREEALKLGAKDYLKKPYKNQDLINFLSPYLPNPRD